MDMSNNLLWARFSTERSSALVPAAAMDSSDSSVTWEAFSPSVPPVPDALDPSRTVAGLRRSGPEEPEHRHVLEQEILVRTNGRRTEAGCAKLVWDPSLAEAAYRHSLDMCRRRFFDHMNPDGHDPMRRAQMAGIRYMLIGENLIMFDTAHDLIRSSADRPTLAEDLVQGWMGSPGHRRNILHAEFQRLGVGAYVTSDDVYATQLFGTP